MAGLWTEQEKKLVGELYPNHTNREIATMVGRTKSSILSYAYKHKLKKSNEHLYKQHSYVGSHSQHTFDENYFHEIDTPDKAYWLGWLWADGWVLKDADHDSYLTGIILNKNDKIIIEKLKECLQASQPIYEIKEKYIGIRFTSKTMFNDLISHGVVPRKSYHAQEPVGVPDELLSHFVRGVFEGDGCISLSYKNRRDAELSIVGTSLFCEWLLSAIEVQTGARGTSRKRKTKSDNTSDIRYSARRKINRIAQWMYQDCGELKLDRKYNKFLESELLQCLNLMIK